MSVQPRNKVYIKSDQIQSLLETLINFKYQTIGPVQRDGVIVYDAITSTKDLPVGWTDEQDAGTYRLKKRDDNALFGYVVGPHSWKQYLHQPSLQLWKANKDGNGFKIEEQEIEAYKYAFIGVRACELAAIAIHDNVFATENGFVDPHYFAVRENCFIVAINCGQAKGTCFCASMDTGPQVKNGFDLALTEVLTNSDHYFLIESGSELGEEVLSGIPHRPATEKEIEFENQIISETTSQMGREIDTTGIKELFYQNYEHPQWNDVAQRCLACANCTMVCPTCFCTSVEDVTDLTGSQVERWRHWDSCFTLDFTYIHGGNIRASIKSRYRQWITHKMAAWIDQFGTSGCVGCGRCITWCPAAIDITAEVRAIQREN